MKRSLIFVGGLIALGATAYAAWQLIVILPAKGAVARTTKDPFSVQFDELRLAKGPLGDVCGWYNARNPPGAYAGFRRFLYHRAENSVTFEPASTAAGSSASDAADAARLVSAACD